VERLILQSLTPAVATSAQDAGTGRQTAPTRWPRSSCSNEAYKYQSDRVRIAWSQPGSKTTARALSRAWDLPPREQRGNRKGLTTFHQIPQCPRHQETARVGARLGTEPDLCCSARLQRARLGVGRARRVAAELRACGSAGCSNRGL